MILACLATLQMAAQPAQGHLADWLESMLESSSGLIDKDEDGFELLVTDLEELYLNPLNLNTATGLDLEKLRLLTPFQIKSLLDYRQKMGKIISIDELHYVFGFDVHTVELIRPFVAIGPPEGYKSKGLESLKHEGLFRISQQNINSENFTGNAQKMYFRYKTGTYAGFQAGVLAEKDAGEDFFAGTNPGGFDHYSGFFSYKGNGFIKNIIMGDYKLSVGQGLLMWNGYTSGKSTEVLQVQKRGQWIRGNSTADEYQFLRGGAITFGTRSFTLGIFTSQKKLDASLDTTSEEQAITTIRETGYHRTLAEQHPENNITEQCAGVRLNYTGSALSWGINSIITNYSLPFAVSDKIYRLPESGKQQFRGISFDYRYLQQNIQLFGEIAQSNGQMAFLQGINLMPVSNLHASVFYRFYHEMYYTPYFNAIAEGSSGSGEEGLFAGLQYSSGTRFKISAYADLFSFRRARYQVDGPSYGKEYLMEGLIRPAQGLEILLRYKFESKLLNQSDTSSQKLAFQKLFEKHAVRIHLRYNLSEALAMATRCEVSKSGYSETEPFLGYLLYQDIFFRKIEKLQFTARYAWFDAREYSSRIYAYEHNLRYVYSMPAYYGKGTRTYLMAHYQPSKSLMATLRWSCTSYFETGIASLHEVSFQCIFRF